MSSLNASFQSRISKLALYAKYKRNAFFSMLRKEIERINSEGDNVIFLLATPCHGDLGDHAIVSGERKLLSDLRVEHRIVELSSEEYQLYKHGIFSFVDTDDLLIINGGNHLGTFQPEIDDQITEIISTYSKNRIIIFPQSCNYEDSIQSDARMAKNRRAYDACKRLTIAFREEESLRFFQWQFPNTEKLFLPDTSLYLNNNRNALQRNGVLFCFRNDSEKTISKETIFDLNKLIENMGIVIKQADTITTEVIDYKNREACVAKKMEEFASCSLVVTDRLSGMIFSVITGTPCIALDNHKGTIRKIANWLKKNSALIVCSDPQQIKSHLFQLYGKGYNYENKEIKAELQTLKQKLL